MTGEVRHPLLERPWLRPIVEASRYSRFVVMPAPREGHAVPISMRLRGLAALLFLSVTSQVAGQEPAAGNGPNDYVNYRSRESGGADAPHLVVEHRTGPERTGPRSRRLCSSGTFPSDLSAAFLSSRSTCAARTGRCSASARCTARFARLRSSLTRYHQATPTRRRRCPRPAVRGRRRTKCAKHGTRAA